MYSEITKQAFEALGGKHGQAVEIEPGELAYKVTYKTVHGVAIKSVFNYVTDCEQYYIRDINA